MTWLDATPSTFTELLAMLPCHRWKSVIFTFRQDTIFSGIITGESKMAHWSINVTISLLKNRSRFASAARPLRLQCGRPETTKNLLPVFSFRKESFELLTRLINSHVRLARVIAKTS